MCMSELPCSYKTRWCPLSKVDFIERERPPPWIGERARADCGLALVPLFRVFIFGAPTEEGFEKPPVARLIDLL